MDHKTYLKCLSEMSNEGKFCEDVLDILKSEIEKDFELVEKRELQGLLQSWVHNKSERPNTFRKIKAIILGKKPIKIGLAELFSHRFKGGNIDNF
jgi:hypothetical protein